MRPDVLVIGAGIFGLSVACAVRRAGLSVRVVDAARVGAGASGGPVGALAPHAPGRWSDLHAFQLAALRSLPTRIAEIEAAGGRPTGYARTGRLIPLADSAARARAEADAAAAAARWQGAGRWDVLDALPAEPAGWVAPEAAAAGVVRETLTARVAPGAYLAALAACLGDAVEEGVAIRGVAPAGAGGPAALTASGRIAAGAVVIAAGWDSWRLATPLAPRMVGSAVKGQAALMALDAPGLPVVTAPGLYIVPHADGVAVGSTSEREFDNPGATDWRLDEVVARARALCPALADAPVLRRWAGLRPKPPGRMPVAGPLPGAAGIWIAGGGFRIGLGIAHLVGDAVAAEIAGHAPAEALPAPFRPGR